MTAGETAGACIAAAIGLLCVAPAAFDCWHKPRTDRRFQRTARKAARAPRTEAEVIRDLAAAKAALEIAQLYEIWPNPPRGTAQLPHQTRQTEEDQ